MYVRIHKQECSENIFLDNHKESGKENIVLKDRIFVALGLSKFRCQANISDIDLPMTKENQYNIMLCNVKVRRNRRKSSRILTININ